jgi:GNAT superfamily N-acetyltransferase
MISPVCGADPSVFAHVVEKDGQVVAIAVWFLNFSTFTGRHGVYLEDLFVREGERRHGYGRALIKALAEVCVQRGYRRFEWSVLDWNEPSIRFYRSIGAVGMDGRPGTPLATTCPRAGFVVGRAAGAHPPPARPVIPGTWQPSRKVRR